MAPRPGTPAVGIGAGVHVIAPDQRVLLIEQERRGRRDWGSLGGVLEMNESIEDCAVREAYEETGLRVRLVRLVSVGEFWVNSRLDGLLFEFLAEPAFWPQEVVIPELDGTTRFCDYRWFSRTDLATLDTRWRYELTRSAWPPDITTPLLRRFDIDG